MSQDEQPARSIENQPTWKELAEFISKQAENDRNVIDYWFKLATALLAIVLVIASSVIAFLGWKTIGDVKAKAETTAQDTAKAKVEEILKQPEIQALVQKTASDLFAKGVFKNETEAKVRELLPAAIIAELRKQAPVLVRSAMEPRHVSVSQRETLAKLVKAAGIKGTIEIKYTDDPEAIRFLRQIIPAFQGLPFSSSAVQANNPPIYGLIVHPLESSDSKALVGALRGAGFRVQIENHRPLACADADSVCLIVGYKDN